MTREEFRIKMNPLLESLHPALRSVLYAQTAIHICDSEKQISVMEVLIEDFSKVNSELKEFDELKSALRLINQVVKQ